MAGQTVTRAQLTEAVYQEVGLSRNESAELVESVIAEISNALERGEMVKISSFGSFAVRQKGQRIGRKPVRKCRSARAGCSSSAPRTR
jgi:integration host factor subunit alpha